MLGGDFDVDSSDVATLVLVFDLGVGIEDLSGFQDGEPQLAGGSPPRQVGRIAASSDPGFFGALGDDAP